MSLLFSISIGAIIGALSRHYLMTGMAKWLGTGFPWGTLFINVLGSFMMGLLVEGFALKWSVSQEFRALLTVGVLGSFTTFSTFSLDTALLIDRGNLLYAFLYITASVLLAIGGLFLGLALIRNWMS